MNRSSRLKAWTTRRERYGLSGRATGEKDKAKNDPDLFATPIRIKPIRVGRFVPTEDLKQWRHLLLQMPPKTDEVLDEINKMIGD